MRQFFTLALILQLNSTLYCQVANTVLEGITSKFQNYCESFPREEMYVQTDRDVYIAGEEIWFSMFLFNRQTATLTGASRIAYFEILNNDNRPVVQKRVGIETGTGSGKIVLPDTLSAGVYTLRAYTNWMKNFMPANCFSRRIKVYQADGKKNLMIPEQSQKIILEKVPVDNGISARIRINNRGLIEAEINSDYEYRTRNSNVCYLFLQTHGVINYKSVVTLSHDTIRVEIPAADIIPGINHLTVFDSAGRPVCETYSFTPGGENNFLHLNIAATDTIKPRGEISVDIGTTDPLLENDSAILCISVVPAGTKMFSSIADYMVFGSEFGQLPDRFNETALNNIPDSIMDDFLSTAKSNWIDWNYILSEYEPQTKYQREGRYHYLYGTVFNNDNAADTTINQIVFLSIPGKNATLQYSVTRPDSSFSFALPADDKTRNLVIQTDGKRKNLKITVLSSFSERYLPLSLHRISETSLPAIVPLLGLNYRVMKIYKTFESHAFRAQEKLTSGTKRFYGKPDIALVMSDYIKLPTMQEVFFELLPGVSLRPKDTGYKMTIRNPLNNRLLDDPLLLIDGVLISDPALIYNIDPETVEKIDVIKSDYVIGDYMFTGLVNVITTKGNLENISLPAGAVRLQYRDYNPEDRLNYPDYSQRETLQSHVPDFRNMLYWNVGALSLSGKTTRLKFFGSDFISDYDIIVLGVTKNGSFVTQKKSIKIQK